MSRLVKATTTLYMTFPMTSSLKATSEPTKQTQKWNLFGIIAGLAVIYICYNSFLAVAQFQRSKKFSSPLTKLTNISLPPIKPSTETKVEETTVKSDESVVVHLNQAENISFLPIKPSTETVKVSELLI